MPSLFSVLGLNKAQDFLRGQYSLLLQYEILEKTVDMNTNEVLSPWVGGMIVNGYWGVGWRCPICLPTRNDGNTKI